MTHTLSARIPDAYTLSRNSYGFSLYTEHAPWPSRVTCHVTTHRAPLTALFRSRSPPHCTRWGRAWGKVNHRPPLILPSRVARDIAVHGASSTLHSAPGCRPFSPAVQAAALAPPSDRRGGPDSPAWSRRRSLGVDRKPVAARPLREALLQRRVQGDGWRAAGERGARLRQVARM